MINDRWIEGALQSGRIRPVKGTVWAQKFLQEPVTSAGIIIPDLKTSEDRAFEAEMYVIRAMGEPIAFDVESCEIHDTICYKYDWDSQTIDIGTVVGCTPAAGLNQERFSEYIQLRWDEIVAIGQPLDEDGGLSDSDYPMLPAPGWFLIQVDNRSYEGAIHIPNPEAEAFVANRSCVWGQIVGEARGWKSSAGLSLGDLLCVPRFAHSTGAIWLEVEKGALRFVREHDVLGSISVEDKRTLLKQGGSETIVSDDMSIKGKE